MISFRIRPEDMGKRAQRLAKEIGPATQRALRRVGAQVIPQVKTESLRQGIKAFGRYVAGWTYEVRGTELRIRNRTFYAKFVESGRRAGARMPPVNALIPWVQLILSPPPDRVRSVAFAVARAIARRGIPPRPVVGSGKIQRLARAAVTRELVAELEARA